MNHRSLTVFATKEAPAESFLSTLKFDIPSSIAAFLVALPLCMGIAIASGVPVAAGLITGIVGGIVVGALAGAPLQVSGPAAGLTVVVYEIVSVHGVAALGMIVFGAGVLQIVAGMFRLGQWFRAVSPAVIHGMLAGIGILIFASQFHVMVDDKPKENGIRNLVSIPQAIAKGLPLPEASTAEQREFRTELLKEVGTLHTRQVTLRDSIAALQAAEGPDEKTDDGVGSENLAQQQAAITAGVQEIAERIRANVGEFSHPEKTSQAAQLAVAESEEALANLQAADSHAELNSQKKAVAGLESLLGGLKNHQWAAKVGMLTICALLAWTWLAPKKLKVIPAPLVAVAVAAVAAFVWNLPVLYVEAPDNLLSAIRMPSLNVLQGDNMVGLIEAILVMALIASAETLLCATAVDKMHGGQRTNYDRELMAQGVGNSICGLLGALPMTGVIVRSAANVQAGARTRKSAMLHGLWLLVFVCFLTPVLRTIPVAGLAAVLVYTGYKLVNWHHIVELKRYGWSEVGIYLATMITIVATDLLTGVIAGIGLSAAKLLYTFAHLKTEVRPDPLRNRINLALSGTATFLRLPLLASALERVPANAELHVDLEQLHYIDHACLDLLMSWAKQHEAAGGTLVIDWDSLHAQIQGDVPLLRKSVA
jgi:MFS superfamily sulfate permease-like transporter